ncbi:A24 family peptidase [Sphingomonas bacterium]|uniref:prepilin peptidase n=1 Tax=Sphingomonas bacterium TaxID=1895847 RepID=UPI0015750A6B|nr:A24 family peptidase [Sphingomonas bacterium]
MNEAAAWAILLGGVGAIIGSFLAALVIRWPAGRSVSRGRSRCDHCDAPVRARDLVPVLSYAVLRGRCRECGAAIDPRHPAIELASLAVGVVAGLVAPGWSGVAGAVFGWLLIALAMLDLAVFWLPDRLTGTLAIIGLAGGGAGLDPPMADRLIGGVAGFGLLWATARAYRLVRHRDGLGGGDPKLLGAIGLWLGWRTLPAVLLVGCLIGLGFVLLQRLRGRTMARDAAMPLGTLLAIAAYPAWVFMISMAS